MDIETFLSSEKSMIIAPAGYGKTYTIAEAIAAYQGGKRVLVLTHTHAGVASLREKITQKDIPPSSYQIDTICSFALELTRVYHIKKDDFPLADNVNDFFKFAVEHAITILRAKPIQKLLEIEYEHLIVDEYQDCTMLQHQMILQLASIIKTHILGDPLQGIFEFRDSLIGFNDTSLIPFRRNCQTLNTPWRWNNAGNNRLGKELSLIRNKLQRNEDIDLNDYHSIEFLKAPETDYTKPHSQYKHLIFNALNDNSVLLIHPRCESVEFRLNYVRQFPQLRLIESIDDKAYYEFCDAFDGLTGQNLISKTVEVMRKIATTTGINRWFNKQNTLINKRNIEDKAIKDSLAATIASLSSQKTYGEIANLMEKIQNLPDVKVYRKDFLHDLCSVLREADRLGLTARLSIERNRNILRRKGRKVQGKGIGTTLLTKGLEFDTVVILNAHQFEDPKHLYVALTRCSKRLVIISQTNILHPYKETLPEELF